LFCRLQYDRIAHGQSWRKFPGLHKQREIPRNYLANNANRLMTIVAEIVAYDGNGLAVILVSPTSL
jgi:hypothetical protein